MKTKINIQEVEVNRIIIDYIKLGHERVQLLIEYYNAIPATFTHKIYTKSTSLVHHRPSFVLILHCGASTQCIKWRPKVFIYRDFFGGAQPNFWCSTI